MLISAGEEGGDVGWGGELRRSVCMSMHPHQKPVAYTLTWKAPKQSRQRNTGGDKYQVSWHQIIPTGCADFKQTMYVYKKFNWNSSNLPSICLI